MLKKDVESAMIFVIFKAVNGSDVEMCYLILRNIYRGVLSLPLIDINEQHIKKGFQSLTTV